MFGEALPYSLAYAGKSEALESETRTGFPEERRLLLAGRAAENGVAMEAAETGDYRMMPLGIVVEVIEGLARTAADLIAQVAEAATARSWLGRSSACSRTR